VRRPLALVAFALVVVAGCRESETTYPPECSNGPRAVRTALAQAPDGEVAIEGTVKLSDCLVPSNDAGPLASFGGSVMAVAPPLVERARRGDDRALLELGYLYGALERGADSGVHNELVFRFEQELVNVDRGSPAFRRGEAAGRERG
jgi:hypothetical protein